MKRKQESQRRNFCFTFNNYTADLETVLRDFLTENCKYAVYGHEVAPTTGTPHLQGFFSLKKQNRTSTLQKALTKLGIKLTLIHANGNAQQNRAYCTKADPQGFFEVGDINVSGQGSRTDLDNVVETIKQGATLEAIAEKHPIELIKYPRGLLTLKSIYDKSTVPEERDITVTVYHGQGGTGKTQHALVDARRLGVALYILSPPNGGSLWWDHYSDEAGLLLDDFYGWIKPHDLYRVLDRYRFQAPIKGGFVWARWTHVWITSNSPPSAFYKDTVMAQLDSEAYNRRLHNIYRLDYFMGAKNAVCLPIIEKEEKPLVFHNEQTSVQNTSVEDAPTAQDDEDS